MVENDVHELQGIADTKRADAEKAALEAQRLADTASALHADAASKISEANQAAAVAAQEVLKKRIDVAEADAATKRAEYADAQAAAVAAHTKAETLKSELEAAEKLAAELIDQQRPVVPSFRVEGGGWRVLSLGSTSKDRQVQDTEGNIYNHVSEHANGDWIYRIQP